MSFFVPKIGGQVEHNAWKTAQEEPGKKPAPSRKPKPQQEVVVQIPLSELHPFPDHSFP